MSSPNYPAATWNITGTTSAAVKFLGQQLVGFLTPATLSGTTITFTMRDNENDAFIPVKDSSGSAVSFTVAVSGYYGFTQDQVAKFSGIKEVQVVSGSSEAAGRIVELALIPRIT